MQIWNAERSSSSASKKVSRRFGEGWQMTGIVTLTTDFGPGAYVGAMKGAILSIDSELTIVDMDHNVRPQDVRHAAFVLYSSVPYFPFAVHVGVVHPGVGTKRRAIVPVCEGALMVGPANGLVLPAGRR